MKTKQLFTHCKKLHASTREKKNTNFDDVAVYVPVTS